MNRCFNFLKNKKGFSLVELLVVVLILGCILIIAVNYYMEYIDTARMAKARQDIDEIVKAIRLYNINEGERFKVEELSPRNLGSFVGNYLEYNSVMSVEPADKNQDKSVMDFFSNASETPKDSLGGFKLEGRALLDPWGRYYQHIPNLGIVYSLGPNGIQEVATTTKYEEPIRSDDIVINYLPKALFITKAIYVDANQNNQIDFNDFIELTFSKPAIVDNAISLDFDTANPVKALGTVSIKGDEKNPMKAKITLIPPIPSHFTIGETTIIPREYIESIYDYTPHQPVRLQRFDALKITKRRN